MTSSQIIGHSVEQRPLTLHFGGSPNATTRVLVIAGQHGDERFARKAAEKWLRTFSSDAVQVAVLIDANPDGSHREERNNAAGVDLNRDHQFLSAPETQAIHAFARQWRPHLIIDVHTYPPRRKHLLAHGLVHANDVFIDVTNNPTACERASWATALKNALPQWIENVREYGYRCDRYTLVTQGGTVRHSTPDVIDARNGLSISLGVPTVLLEGRERTRHDDRTAKRRTIDGLITALNTIVHDAAVRWSPEAAEPNDLKLPVVLPIRSRYVPHRQSCELEFFDAAHQQVSYIRLPGAYLAHLTKTLPATSPVAYVIPQRCTALLDLLKRHGIMAQHYHSSDTRPVQTQVRRVERSSDARRPPRRLRTSPAEFPGELGSYVTFLVTSDNVRLLTCFLEAHSKYALCRYEQLGIYPQPGKPYPILRLESAEQMTPCAVH